jgi:hypothetical protein
MLCGGVVNAGYHRVIADGYSAGFSLEDDEVLLMTGGGVHDLILFDNSQAVIQGTSPLSEDVGGIWDFTSAGYSQLEFSGGGIHEFTIGSYAEAVFSGGRIDKIRSLQQAWVLAGDPPAPVPYAHITFVCDVDSVVHDVGSNMLTGDWLDGSGFEVQLVDIDGYSRAIDNIQFIPEPATLLLMGAGGLLLRKRR